MYLIFKPFPNFFPARFFPVHKDSNPVYFSRQECHTHKRKNQYSNRQCQLPCRHSVGYPCHHHHRRGKRYHGAPKREGTVGILESVQHKEKANYKRHCNWENELLGIRFIVNCCPHCGKHAGIKQVSQNKVDEKTSYDLHIVDLHESLEQPIAVALHS